MPEIELIEIEPGAWAYQVAHFYQPFDPELPGREPMSRDRALALGEIALASLAQ